MLKIISECCNAEMEEEKCSSCNKEAFCFRIHTCKGCEEDFAEERNDAYGIFTGYWCDSCYESDKYPYRKDRYPTIEYDGWGECLGD